MEFLESFGPYLIGIGIGAMLLVISSIMNQRDRKRLSNTTRATVVACKPVENNVNGMYLKSYEITLEMYIGSQAIQKTIKRGKEMQEWEIVSVLYDREKDELTLAEVEKKNESEVPKIVGILGMIAIAATFILYFVFMPDMDERTKAHLFSIGMVSIFTFIGLYLCVIAPAKRNKRSHCCDIVEGVLVDYHPTQKRRGKTSFCPEYEYYYDGKVKRYSGTVGGTSKKYREIGKRVSLAVDRETNKVYCLEEERSAEKFGVGIVVITLAFIALIISWM